MLTTSRAPSIAARATTAARLSAPRRAAFAVARASNDKKKGFFEADLVNDLKSVDGGETLDGLASGNVEAVAGVVGLASTVVCGYSLYVLQNTGCGLPVRDLSARRRAGRYPRTRERLTLFLCVLRVAARSFWISRWFGRYFIPRHRWIDRGQRGEEDCDGLGTAGGTGGRARGRRRHRVLARVVRHLCVCQHGWGFAECDSDGRWEVLLTVTEGF